MVFVILAGLMHQVTPLCGTAPHSSQLIGLFAHSASCEQAAYCDDCMIHTLNIRPHWSRVPKSVSKLQQHCRTCEATIIDATIVDATIIDATIIDATIIDATIIDAPVRQQRGSREAAETRYRERITDKKWTERESQIKSAQKENQLRDLFVLPLSL